MLQGHKLNKGGVKMKGLLRGSAVSFCLLATAQITYGQATGYMSPVGQVGQHTPISSFGQVGGRTTTTSSGYLQSISRGAPPSGPTGGYVGKANYSVDTGVGGGLGQSRSNPSMSSLNQNAALANQMFGKNATTSVLGRVTPRSNASAMDYLIPTFNTRAAAARASNFYRGRTPAAAMLDRDLLLAPKSALGQMASGPRNSLAFQNALVKTGDASGAPAEGDLSGGLGEAGASAIPAGLTPEQRREYKTKQEYQGCLERGDDYMRAKDFHRAKASYERARTIAPDLAAPYCRLFMVTLLMTDYAQSGTFLRLATRRAKTAGEMRMNLSECTPSTEDVRVVARTIAQANLRADTSEAEFVTLAYLSWLLDDTAIMRGELDRAARVSTNSPEANKLRELLLSNAAAQPQS